MGFKYKLIVSDFDDTLLNSDNVVSQKNVQAIKDYQAAGGIFTIATGRSLGSMIVNLKDTGLDFSKIPLIVNQGGKIAYLDGRILKSYEIEHKTAVKLLEYVENQRHLDFELFVFIGGKPHVVSHTQNTQLWYSVSKEELTPVGNLLKYVKDTKTNIDRITIMAYEPVIDFFVEDFKKQSELKGLNSNTSKPVLFDITPSLAHKEEGIRFLQNHLGIDNSETIAVGDSMNDETMLKYAGLGVAVKNAREYIQSIADYVTENDNDNDAIAEIIYKAMTNKL